MRNAMQEARPVAENREREGGFTLLEVILAISILTVGILAIAAMQISAIRGNAFASGVTEGATWSAAQIEQLMDLRWDASGLQDTDGDGTAGLEDTGAQADHQSVEEGYNIHWNVAEGGVTANTKTVTVIVTWSEHGAPKEVSMHRVVPRIF